LAVWLEPGQHACTRAGSEDDVLGAEIGNLLAVLGDGDLALAGKLPLAVEHCDLILLHEEADAARELLRHLARPLDHLLGVEADLLGRKAELVEIVEEMVDLRRAQQRLGRDAAPVEADAAEMLALDDRRLHAELRRPDRRDITAGAGADDDEIEGCIGHSGSPRATSSAGLRSSS